MSLYASLDKYANRHNVTKAPGQTGRTGLTWDFCQGSMWLILV